MKILITSPSLDSAKNISGISAVVNSIIESNHEHQYYHYCLGRKDKDSRIMSVFILIRQLLIFPFFITSNKIDVVHQNLPFDKKGLLREIVINFIARVLGRPVVLHIHGGVFLQKQDLSGIWKVFRDYIFKGSKKIIVLSEKEKFFLNDYHSYSGACVLRNSINASFYKRQKKYIPKDFTFLFLGRLDENKGLKDIYECFKILTAKNLKFNFIVCGAGELEEFCKIKFKELLGDRFEFRGVVSGLSKLEALHDSAYFILPSYFEGLPVSMLEAMASGVIPIVTNVGSIADVIQDGINGVIVEPKNPINLSLKIQELLNKPYELQNSIRNNAFLTIESDYNVDSYVNNLNRIYASL